MKNELLGQLHDHGLYEEIERNGEGVTDMPADNVYFQPGMRCKVIAFFHDENFENFEAREIVCSLEKIGRIRRVNGVRIQKLKFKKEK